uniref:Ion transport domain-containing protein n=1 Tax=Rhizophagus irregularis (strain DAOM 181602 / DAOM 197198 / MUCL 43194) TaxID=747089 RepID=U9TLX0_RHIID
MDNNIFDIEPWLDSDHYQISYWLDYSKTLRISYGFYTIQIWENDELIYIWSDYNIDNYNLSNKILTQYIELLDISQDDNGNITSKFRCIDVEHELQISKLVNNEFLTKDHAIGAYNSLIFFSKLKLTNISYKLKIDELIEQTKRIIYNIIIKKPNLWRLLDVRYNLMENLIYNQSNDIIKFILNSTEETKKNAKRNQKLHIPQLYDWNGNIRSNHELLIALKENNIEVIQQITNYYSCNAIENTGWMITLTRALPELNKKLPEYFLFLRIIPVVGEYIFIITFLISKVIPYFLTMMIMVFGFGFSMFIIFSNAAILGIKPQSDEYQFSNITIQQKIDSPNFFETLEMVYLWLFGNWDDVKNWDYIPIKILALLASFFIVIIMQNIFVALMAEDISTARNYSVIASLKSKTDYIIQAQYQNYYYLRNFGSYFYLNTFFIL